MNLNLKFRQTLTVSDSMREKFRILGTVDVVWVWLLPYSNIWLDMSLRLQADLRVVHSLLLARDSVTNMRGLWLPGAGSLWYKRTGVATLSAPRPTVIRISNIVPLVIVKLFKIFEYFWLVACCLQMILLTLCYCRSFWMTSEWKWRIYK